MLPLRELQTRFLAAMTGSVADGGPVSADPALLALVARQGALAPVERLQIYADMYRARLLDVLREDFPRVAAVVGDERFAALAGRYLRRHPSTHPSVRYVGARFADHVATEPGVPGFLADLARLEWARVDVFDAPDPRPLALGDLAGVAPEAWGALRLRPIEACRLVEAAWPVHDVWAAAADPAPDDPRLTPAPAATTIRVWREGFAVSHAAMGTVEVQAFRALAGGAPFATVCEAVALAPEAAAREVGALLLRWLEDGLLAR